MRHALLVALSFVTLCLAGVHAGDSRQEADAIKVGPSDWPWWRGPTRDGVAAADQKAPVKWSATENVLWKAPVPGRGHGSPIVVGDQIFLATADHERDVQSVLCFERASGKVLWQTPVHKGGFKKEGNPKASMASATAACDGQRVYINFLNGGAIHTTALDRAGKILWQTKVTDYVLHQGFGSSPAVYKSLVLVSADNKGTGAIAGLERATGKIVWKVQRPQMPNYASPIIHNIAGKDQLFFIGCELVTSLDPMTGKKHWEIPGSTTECVTSTVTDGVHMFTSGGYPTGHVAAVRADGSGKVAWQINTKVYVPSMLTRGGYLYAVLDNGFAACWKCDTGKEQWRERLSGGFTASPVLVGDNIYATNESGETFIFKASPESFQLVAKNNLGGEVLATPTICGGRIYVRIAHGAKDKRQESLVCIGGQ